MKKRTMGTVQEWGADEVRILTTHGWVICSKGRELEEELNDIESIERSMYEH